MNPANTDKRRIKPFQIRWNEPLGKPECPYMYRWVFTTPLFSIRLHKWLRSDDKRYLHNHPFSFLTIILKGGYTDVTEEGEEKLKFLDIRYRNAAHTHCVKEPIPNTYTLLFCGPAKHKWGFFVRGKFFRPLRFFNRYGHPPCSEI